MNCSGTLRGSRPTAGQLRPRILRLIRADALAARGRIHPGLPGKEPSSTKYNPAPSLRALLFDVPRSVPSGSSATRTLAGNGVVGSVWLAPVVSSIPHLMPARSSARRPLSVASFG